jgi:VanZ family protein
MFRYIKDYLLTIFIFLVITYLSLAQPPQLGILLFKGWDKVVHFCMYGILSAVFWVEFLIKHRSKKANYIYAWIGGVLYPILFGGVIELCQQYITRYRSGDWWDFWSDMGGVVLATFFAWFILRPWIKKKSS